MAGDGNGLVSDLRLKRTTRTAQLYWENFPTRFSAGRFTNKHTQHTPTAVQSCFIYNKTVYMYHILYIAVEVDVEY